MYEVFLAAKKLDVEIWKSLVVSLVRLHRQGERFELRFVFDPPNLQIFLVSSRNIPNFLSGLDGFVFKTANPNTLQMNSSSCFLPFFARQDDNLMGVGERLELNGRELASAFFEIRKIGWDYTVKTYLAVKYGDSTRLMRVYGAGLNLLDLDLRRKYILRKPPKYLNLSRTLCLADSSKVNPLMELEVYPYLKDKHYLNLKNYDFHKHTVFFGASGTGKTKLLSKLISEIARSYSERYHVLVIDPHDSIKDEIGGLAGVKVLDFSDKEHGLNLFLTDERNIISAVDMSLALFKSLIGDDWNSRLARLLRASIYLLSAKNDLNFQNLRRLLTDPAFKNACLKELGDYLPENLQEFFGHEYNELKTQHYDATFARILSLIDELQMTPALYRKNECRLDYELSENKATIISLSSAKLGESATKMIAGLAMNQLFLLGLSRRLHEHVILVIDEVAVIENPVLRRFLSEARKYNITVILAGQYFSQISIDLRTAIHANVANYFCLRLNYDDAEMMSKYLNIDLSSSSQPDYLVSDPETFAASESEKIKLLASLADRQVIARLSRNGIVLPAISGRSLDYEAKPLRDGVTQKASASAVDAMCTYTNKKQWIKPSNTFSVFDLMREQSTGRRKVN